MTRRSILPARFLPRPPITPRKLQVLKYQELMLNARNGHRRQTIVAPPGFGKSLLGLMFAGHLVQKGLSRFDGVHQTYCGALIVVPMLSLMLPFTSVRKIGVPDGGMGPGAHRAYDLEIGWAQEIGAHPSSATEDEIATLWKHGGVAILTYQALHKIWGSVPEHLEQWHLHVDEAHHVPLREGDGFLTEIAHKEHEWLQRGGSVMRASATPWHTESGRRIYHDNEARVVVSISDLRDAKLAPSNFEVHRLMLGVQASTWKDMLLEGKPTAALVRAYDEVAQYWIAQGRPVVVVRPPDRKHVAPLVRAFVKAGADPKRILDATGPDFDGGVIATERELGRYADRSYDVILACRRFDEGTDLPWISNVYYIGAPASVRLVIQLIGRTLRVKDMPGYPAKWRDRSALSIFIPRGKAAATEYLREHIKDITMLAAYIADVEVGDTVITHLASRLRESLVFGNDEGLGGVRERIVSQVCGDDVTKAEAAAALDKMIYETSRELGDDAQDVAASIIAKKIIKVQRPALRSAMITVFAERMQKQHPAVVEELVREYETIIESARADVSMDEQIHAAHVSLAEGFRRVAEAFSHLHRIAPDRKLLHILSKFTGLEADEIAKQLRRLCMSHPTKADVIRAIHSYIKRTGTYPTKASGATDKSGLPGYTWSQIATRWAAFGFDEESLEDYGRLITGATHTRTRRRT